MFYRIEDTAIERHTFEDGTEVAVVYDQDCRNPLEDFAYLFSSIERNERGYARYDPNEYMKEMDGWEEDHEAWVGEIETSVYFLVKEFGERWFENEEAHESGLFQELVDHLETSDEPEKPAHLHEYTLQAANEWGHPEFRVVIDSGAYAEHTGCEPTPENIAREARGLVDMYGAWAEGSVYTVGVTTPDGDTDYLSGIYEDKAWTPETLDYWASEITGHNPLRWGGKHGPHSG